MSPQGNCMQQTKFRRPEMKCLFYRIQFQKTTLALFIPSDNYLNCSELFSQLNYLLGKKGSKVSCFDMQKAFILAKSPK
jgi:hypothetical protein